MNKRFQILLAAALTVSAMLPVSPVSGQTVCREGRTLQGRCISPAVGAAARKQAIVMTQQKFSYSTRLTLPVQDQQYRTPFDYREFQRGLFSTSPFPYSCHPNC